jgi:hypothetical protein
MILGKQEIIMKVIRISNRVKIIDSSKCKKMTTKIKKELILIMRSKGVIFEKIVNIIVSTWH